MEGESTSGRGEWLTFTPCASFQGARTGHVFQAGPLGIGYYPDPAIDTSDRPSATSSSTSTSTATSSLRVISESAKQPLSAHPVVSARQRRLMKLKMKMNKARKSNHDEVLNEGRRLMDPKATQKKRKREEKRRREEWESSVVATGLKIEQNHMLATAERANREEAALKKKKKRAAAFGWSMFNQDSLQKGHSKRVTAALPRKNQEAASSNPSTTGGSVLLGSEPSSEAVDRMVAELDQREKLRSNFSRRREVFDEEHRTHINESNRTFNKKLARAYDKHTVELRQSLERGTS